MAKKGKTNYKNKKRRRRKIKKGVATVKATFNNTIISISDEEGNVLVQSSPPHVGFTGSRKSTAYAATRAAATAGEEVIKKYGMNEVQVALKGVGSGRNAAVKGLASSGLRVTMLIDRTRIPHNGCRARKQPRK